ncbi:tetratricopeptide repeat protein [Oryzomonas rubra]|uniref:Tetratricopeptide repeat protein n=1 Tax=Oryzomonas rubra TaxID=2509454 RepID=A0A5A9XS72_9BACT|nr:tetratricopeptide repeat protein [Oryzomonas rubra]KAA0895098.1 tetratricopeptide repeat protein [Oryzomonas rubra]
MMKCVGVRILSFILPLVAAAPALAGMQLYRGTMEAVTAPSKSCEGVLGKHPATLVINEDGVQDGLNGYLESEGVVVGKVAGPDLAHLGIAYPGQAVRGNTISLTRSGAALAGELNGATTVNHCTFDLGRLALDRVDDEGSAKAAHQRLANLFAAQATLYQAFSLTQNGSCEEALPLFEKSLGLADSVFGQGSPQLTHFIRGLSNCYAKLGRTKEFNALYDQRIGTISDESLKAGLTKLRISALMQDGRILLAQAEYEAALKVLMQAYQLNPQNKDSIHTVMAVYIRSSRYSEAVAFLEQAAGKLEEAADRKEINDIIALVYFKKAMKDAQNGKEGESEASLRKSVALDPGSSQYLVALARMRHKAGHFDEAQKMLSQGLERITDEQSRQEILAMQEKLRQTEMIIKKLQ